MQKNAKEYAIKLLEGVVSAIKADTSEIDTETALQIADLLAHRPLSKAQASAYLGMSISKFNLYLRLGRLPKGRKRVGYKELTWYADELNKYKTKV